MARAPAALKTLAKDGGGKLTPEEVRPNFGTRGPVPKAAKNTRTGIHENMKLLPWIAGAALAGGTGVERAHKYQCESVRVAPMELKIVAKPTGRSMPEEVEGAMATSGNYRRGVFIGGNWYSHIVASRTGMPVDHVISTTVVAPHAADAGTLATIFNVVPREKVSKLAAKTPDLECMLVASNTRRINSAGWASMEMPLAAAAQTTAHGAWNPAFELLIPLELSRFDGQAYRGPFVAVWIEARTSSRCGRKLCGSTRRVGCRT